MPLSLSSLNTVIDSPLIQSNGWREEQWKLYSVASGSGNQRGCFLSYPTPNILKLHRPLLCLPLQLREAPMMKGLLFHPRVGGPPPEHKNILLFSYLGSHAPTQAAQKSLPAPGQILALVSDEARQQPSQGQALNPRLCVPLAFPFLVLFLFAQKPR